MPDRCEAAVVDTAAETTQTPTLIVGDWASACSACGHGSDLTPAHQVILPGYGIQPRVSACGVTYVAVALSAGANEDGAGRCREIAAELGLPYAGVADRSVAP